MEKAGEPNNSPAFLVTESFFLRHLPFDALSGYNYAVTPASSCDLLIKLVVGDPYRNTKRSLSTAPVQKEGIMKKQQRVD